MISLLHLHRHAYILSPLFLFLRAYLFLSLSALLSAACLRISICFIRGRLMLYFILFIFVFLPLRVFVCAVVIIIYLNPPLHLPYALCLPASAAVPYACCLPAACLISACPAIPAMPRIPMPYGKCQFHLLPATCHPVNNNHSFSFLGCVLSVGGAVKRVMHHGALRWRITRGSMAWHGALSPALSRGIIWHIIYISKSSCMRISASAAISRHRHIMACNNHMKWL